MEIGQHEKINEQDPCFPSLEGYTTFSSFFLLFLWTTFSIFMGFICVFYQIGSILHQVSLALISNAGRVHSEFANEHTNVIFITE